MIGIDSNPANYEPVPANPDTYRVNKENGDTEITIINIFKILELQKSVIYNIVSAKITANKLKTIIKKKKRIKKQIKNK